MSYKIANSIALILSGALCIGIIYIWTPDILGYAFDRTSQQEEETNKVSHLEASPDYTTLKSRPIFQKSRRYKVLERDQVQPDKSFIPYVPLVKGVAITEPGEGFVFIQSSKDGIVYQLRVGDFLDGIWRVTEITLKEILLLDENGDTISLDVKADAKVRTENLLRSFSKS